jgi:glyoxylase-like metal-dependent hydrolase (beta-lactamase superfamily II)
MSEILPGVHAVEGIHPSPDFSTNVCLVKDKGDRWVLVDTGLPGSASKIEAYLTQHHIPLGSIHTILITHLHRDHVGSLRDMIAKTRAKTYAHWIEAAYIARDPPYDGPGVPPEVSVTVDEQLKDGDRIDVAGGVVAYHTPGHTPGHTAYLFTDRKLLFSGDLYGGTGKELSTTMLKEFNHHQPTVIISARRMAGVDADSVIVYHGAPILRGGREALRRAAESG